MFLKSDLLEKSWGGGHWEEKLKTGFLFFFLHLDLVSGPILTLLPARFSQNIWWLELLFIMLALLIYYFLFLFGFWFVQWSNNMESLKFGKILRITPVFTLEWGKKKKKAFIDKTLMHTRATGTIKQIDYDMMKPLDINLAPTSACHSPGEKRGIWRRADTGGRRKQHKVCVDRQGDRGIPRISTRDKCVSHIRWETATQGQRVSRAASLATPSSSSAMV